MEVIYYKRTARSTYHVHAGSKAVCLYVPSRDVVLVRELLGSFGNVDYYAVTRKEVLEEARMVSDGDTKDLDPSISVSEMSRSDIDDKTVEEVIQKSLQKSELQEQVENGIENLISNFEME